MDCLQLPDRSVLVAVQLGNCRNSPTRAESGSHNSPTKAESGRLNSLIRAESGSHNSLTRAESGSHNSLTRSESADSRDRSNSWSTSNHLKTECAHCHCVIVKLQLTCQWGCPPVVWLELWFAWGPALFTPIPLDLCISSPCAASLWFVSCVLSLCSLCNLVH